MALSKLLSRWWRRIRRRSRRYDVFISYSHRLDRGLAPGIQAGLQSLAKPWYRRHAVRVFRDSSNLGAAPALWPSIRSALVRSRHFVLLASPEAASSKWVQREVKLWLRLNGTRRLYLALTAGNEPVWGHEASVRMEGDPIPAALADFSRAEPLWVDFRGIRGDSEFRRDNEPFRTAIARLAAPIRGMTPSELIGEDYRQFRRTIRTAWSAATALAALLLATIVASYIAETARQEAVRQSTIALARQLAAQADLVRNEATDRQDESALLAVESIRLAPGLEGDQALRRSLGILPVARLPHDDAVGAIVFSANGRYLASMSGVTARVFETATHKEIITLSHPALVERILFSPDARYLATADRSNTVRVIDITTGTTHAVEHPDWVLSAAFSADSRSLITGSRDTIVRTVDTATGEEVGQLMLPGPVIALSMDARLAGTTTDHHVVQLIETGTGKKVAQFLHSREVYRLYFSPDARYVATVDGGNTFRVFETSNGREAIAVSFPATIQSNISGVAFSLDDLYVAIAVGRTARVFALTEGGEADQIGKEVARIDHNNDVNTVAFSGDGRYIATGSEEPSVRVLDRTKAKQVVALSHQGKVYAVEFSPDGRSIAVGGSDNMVRLFPTVADNEVIRIAPNDVGASVDVARESSRLVAARWDVARVVDAISGMEERRYPLGGPLMVAVSVDGHYAVAVGSLYAHVFEVESGREIGQVFVAELNFVLSVALSRQGRYLAIGNRNGAHVFESATGKAIGQLAPSPSAVNSLAFSPDGRFRQALPTAAGRSDEEIVALELRLHDGQSCVARSYGFASWADLRSYVEVQAASRDDHAKRVPHWLRLVYSGDVDGRGIDRANPRVAARVLVESPDVAAGGPYLACAIGDEDALRAATKADPAFVNRPGGPLRLPPLVAVTHSSLCQVPELRERLHRCARFLLSAGADPNQRIGLRWPPASVAAPDDDHPLSALYGAAGKNHDLELTKILLDAGADPNDDESLYHSLETFTCTRALLEKGARIGGTNALFRALDFDNFAALELLLQHGADPNEPLAYSPLTEWGLPLLWAIRRRRSRRHVAALLQAGADPAASTLSGVSSYSLALQLGLGEVAELLRENGGAKPIPEDEQFIAACARGDEAEAQRIRLRRPDPPGSLQEARLRLLPDLAAEGGDEGARLMVKLGWPVAVRGGDWNASALNLAVFRGNAGLTRFLLEHGASWQEEHGHDDNVCGTLSWASRNEPVEDGDWAGCARALLDHGMPGATLDPENPDCALVAGCKRRFSDEVADILLEAHDLP
jgi:WD40 repeat protein/ankyrin repeat protein